MDVKNPRAVQAESTRKALCQHARKVFAQKGYAEASTDEIVRRAGVTKGALYHHFENKLELYRAVVEEMERELVSRIEAAGEPHADAWERLKAMCEAYLDACLQSDFARILVLEAPAVLGWRLWCHISGEYEIAAFAAALQEAVYASRATQPPAEAQVLLGALNTAARVVATAVDAAAARRQVEETIDRLLAGLRAPAPLG